MKNKKVLIGAIVIVVSVVVALSALEYLVPQNTVIAEAKTCSCKHHKWKKVYGRKKVVVGTKEVWVVDEEAYDEDEIGTEGYAVRCRDCGREFAQYDEYVAFVKERGAVGDYAHGCYEVLLRFVVVGTIHHDEVGHWETKNIYEKKKYVKYKVCKKCGKRKKVSK